MRSEYGGPREPKVSTAMVALTSVQGRYLQVSPLSFLLTIGLGRQPGVQVPVVHEGRDGLQTGPGDGADWSQRLCELSPVKHLEPVPPQWE